jgi:RHS repeat-associated protein
MSMGVGTWLTALVVATATLIAACSEPTAPEETAAIASAATSSTQCSFTVTKNVYDHVNWWGTITFANNGPSSASNFVVEFDVPSGKWCTADQDAVPAGATLSPLVGSGLSAHTPSNHCIFTWTNTTPLLPGKSKTFSYSTNSNSSSFTAATSLVVSDTMCDGSGSSCNTFTVNDASYDGPNWWGTIKFTNDGPYASSSYSVAFDVPPGSYCTADKDAVPAGATLSPLVGTGLSAHTPSNHCIFTWATGPVLSVGASKTFSYSANTQDGSPPANLAITDAMCSGSGGGTGSNPGSGTITSPTDDVGATPGSLEITAAGTATYTIPLWTPEGRNGFSPNLALSYSSSGGESAVGQGWSVSGASSVIHACVANSARDARPLPITSGTLCLDGQRLVVVSAPGATQTEFRTQPDTFAKVVLEDSDQDGPRRFTVYTPDGLVHSYGSSTDTSLETSADVSPWVVNDASRSDQDVKQDLGATHRTRVSWLRGSVADRFGNKISFHHLNSSAIPGSQEPLVDLIGYVDVNGTNTRTIVFTYTNRANPAVAYKLGVKLGASKVLSSIEMKVTPPGTQTAKTVRFYKLVQMNSATTNRPRLDSIQECENGTNAAICKRATVFTYQPGSDTYLEIPDPDDPGPSANAYYAMYPADLNGDGKSDLVFRQLDPTHPNDPPHWYGRLALGSGNSVSFDQKYDLQLPPSGDAADPMISDFNYDGYADVAVPNGSGGYSYHLNPGSAGGAFTQVAVDATGLSLGAMIADFSGRGQLSILRPASSSSNQWTYSNLRTNCVPVIAQGGGSLPLSCTTDRSAISGPLGLTFESNVAAGWSTFAADVDGDGIPELVSRGSAANHLMYATQSAIPGSTPSSSDWSAAQPTTLLASKTGDLIKYIFLDQNGDGLKDAIRFKQGQPTPELLLNTGAGYAKPQPLALAGTVGNVVIGSTADYKDIADVGARVVDYDRDGRDDILLVDNGKVRDSKMSSNPTTRNNAVLLVSRGGSFEVRSLDGQSGRPKVPLSAAADGLIPPTGAAGGLHNYRGTQVLDANGDGLPDIYMYDAAAQVAKIQIHQGSRSDMLTGVTDGMGKKTTIAYLPMSSRVVYTNPKFCGYPQTCVLGNELLVSSTKADDGKTGADNATTYQYETRTFDLAGGGLLGFAKRHIIEDKSSTTTTETYDYDSETSLTDPAGDMTTVFTNLGAPAVEIKTVGSNFVRTVKINTSMEVVETNGGRSYTRRLFSTSKEVKEKLTNGADQQVMTTNTRIGYDPLLVNYGVASNSITSTSMARQTTNVPVDNVDIWKATYDDPTTYFTVPWLLGKKNREVRCSTTPLDAVEATVDSCDGPPGGPGAPPPVAKRVTTFVNERGTGRVTSLETQPEGTADEHLHVEFALIGIYGQVGTVTRTDPATGTSRVDKSTFDAQSVFPATHTNALNQTGTVQVDPGLGVVLSSADANGATTQRSYDTFGRLRRVDDPSGAGLTQTYARENDPRFSSSLGRFVMRTTRTLDGGGEIQTLTDRYDREIRRQQKNLDGTFSYVQKDYDNLGLLDTVTRPSASATAPGSTSHWTHDNLGRLTGTSRDEEAVVPLGAAVTTAATTSTYASSLGSIINTMGSETGKLSRFTRDAIGRIVISESFNDNAKWVPVEYKYGAFGDLRFVVRNDGTGTPANAKTTENVYDSLGRLTSFSDPSTGTRTKFYNPFGDVREEHDGNGKVVKFVPDALGRVTQRIADVDGTTATTYTWDTATNGKGKLAKTSSPTGVTRAYLYDTAGRMYRETWTIDGTSYPIDYTFDPSSGKVVHTVYPSVTGFGRLTVTNTYDADTGRLSEVRNEADNKAYWTLSEANVDGSVKTETFGNGVATAYDVSQVSGRLRGTSSKFGTSTLRSWGYAYLADGGLQRRSNLAPAGGGPAQHEGFLYDNLDRLSAWSDADDHGKPLSSGWAVNYTVNDFGQLTDRVFAHGASTGGTDQSIHLPTDLATDRVTTSPWGGFGYDGNGNQTQRFTGTSDNETVTYTSFDLPKTIAGPRPTTFAYEASGVRAKKATSSTNYSIYVGGLYEKRVSPSGSSTAVEHVLSVMGPAGPIAQVRRREGTSPEVVVYLHRDGLGSIDTVSDSSGAIAEQTRRDPYGLAVTNFDQPTVPIAIAASANKVRLGFTGQEQDDDIGLINMRGRLYDPRLARFLTPDPIVTQPLNGQNYNRYSYVLNNPLKYTDPTGFCDSSQYAVGNDCLSAEEYQALIAAGVTITCSDEAHQNCTVTGAPQGVTVVVHPPCTDNCGTVGPGPAGNDSSGGGGGGPPSGGTGGGGGGGPPPKQPPPGQKRPEDCTKCAGSVGIGLLGLPGGDPDGEYAPPWDDNRVNLDAPETKFGWAAGIELDGTFIMPTSGGGGQVGLNLEYTSDNGFGLFLVTPTSAASEGVGVGLSLNANVAVGHGSWAGPFENRNAGIGALGVGHFQSSPGSYGPGEGYAGISVGVGKGPLPLPVSASYCETNYTPLLGH